MQRRWIILLVLFFARATMAFQFQSVAALSPLLIDSLLLTLVDIGLLVGLYLGPGVIVAILGGTLSSRFGDKRTVSVSLVLMLIGSLLMAYSPNFSGLLAGRVIAGVGGVIVNVVMTKMVIDWFNDSNIATAMAVFISSWPLGIATALLILPMLAESGGLDLAWYALTALTVIALVLFVAVYSPPDGAIAGNVSLNIASLPWSPLVMAALVWGLYNSAFAMVFAFGSIILLERGLDVASASSMTSLFMIAGTLGVPAGGWLADRIKRRDTIIAVGLLVGTMMFPATLYLPPSLLWVMLGLTGFIFGLSAGPIVSLAAYIPGPSTRAFGMGIFYSIYYLLMMLAPPLAGSLADFFDNVNVVFGLGTVMLLIALLALVGFRLCASAAHSTD